MLWTTKPFIAYYFNLNKDTAIKKVAVRCQGFIRRRNLVQFQPHQNRLLIQSGYCQNHQTSSASRSPSLFEKILCRHLYFHLWVFVLTCHTFLLFCLGPLVWLDKSTGEVKIMGVVSYGPGKSMSSRKLNHQKC